MPSLYAASTSTTTIHLDGLIIPQLSLDHHRAPSSSNKHLMLTSHPHFA